ncbi:hypothetical protein PUN28_003619 [Cardiocondyla obscurior]|uniref:Uncharacterized protein n=1 Tax=Cardiocondyla obscurior TaxID=286306 RepID=A0AAW2GL76_9HYME
MHQRCDRQLFERHAENTAPKMEISKSYENVHRSSQCRCVIPDVLWMNMFCPMVADEPSELTECIIHIALSTNGSMCGQAN